MQNKITKKKQRSNKSSRSRSSVRVGGVIKSVQHFCKPPPIINSPLVILQNFFWDPRKFHQISCKIKKSYDMIGGGLIAAGVLKMLHWTMTVSFFTRETLQGALPPPTHTGSATERKKELKRNQDTNMLIQNKGHVFLRLFHGTFEQNTPLTLN